MPWNIGLAGNDFNILNSKINEVEALTYNNIIDFVNYFMISENGNVGINNKNPTEKLDIKGNTIVNGTLLTSNVIGWRIDDTSNILKINYTDDIINNNNLEIYGKSTFKGNIAIGDDNNYSILNINGLVNATEFKGTGSNIINIDADNINKGILNASFGGTGINNIKNEQILYGSNNNTVGQTPGFRFLEGLQRLEVANLKGNGSLVENINAHHITSGILSGRYGGTGKASYEIEGGLLVGNIRAPGNSANIDQTINLKWDDNASNLLINGNLKLFGTNKTIFINDEPLGYQHIGPYNVATSEIPGVIKYDGNTFKFNDAGQLILNVSTSSKWEKNEDESIIWYPKYSDPNSVQLECVGIGFIPDENVDRVNRLSVKGNINIKSYTNSPGAYLINGINVDEINSNFLSKKIDDLILDNIKQEYGGVNKRCFDLINIGTQPTYKISGDNRNFYFDNLVEFQQGIRISEGGSIGFDGALTIESLNLTSGTRGVQNNAVLTVNQVDNEGDKSTIAQFEYRSVAKMLLDKEGRLGIGAFNGDNFPKEKLDVQGNIIASGYITSYYSDERLKHFTSRIKNSLEIINNLNGYYYEPNEKALQFGFKHEKQIGLSAQEVTKYIPEITKLAPFDAINDADGNVISKSGESYLTICYERLGPIFVEAIKELTNEIRELKKENIFIKSELERIKLSI
jgi:hypothetical protein